MNLKEKLAADLAKKAGGAAAMAAAKEVAVIAGNIGGSGVATVDNASMNQGVGVSKFKSLSAKLNGTSVPKTGTHSPDLGTGAGRAINPPDASPDPRLKKAEVVAEPVVEVAAAPVVAAPTEEKRKPGRPAGSTKKVDVATSSVETKKIVENVVATYVSSEVARHDAGREMEMRFEIVKACISSTLVNCASDEDAESVVAFARKVVEGIR